MADSRLILGLDIGGTKCAAVLGTSQGQIIARRSFPTVADRGPATVLDEFTSVIDSMCRDMSLSVADVRACGVSCGGPLDSRKGIILSPPNLPGWDRVPVTQILSSKLHMPVYLQNDANACVLAEWRFGAGRGCDNLVFLTFGTGMGAGLILNGRLYSGTNDLAGEVGHVRLDETGPVGYGKEGSFEGFCSGGGIARLGRQVIRRYWSEGHEVQFWPKTRDLNELTARDIGLAADTGDEVAVEILSVSGHYLGKGLSVLIDILNPEIIIIGSIFGRCQRFLEPAAREAIEAEALGPAAAVCRLVPAGLGERIGDYGSLCVALTALDDDRSAGNTLANDL